VVDSREVLRQVEGNYLLDYATFTGAIRVYVTSTLEREFKQDKHHLHRRMFLLAVLREEYSAYEDLGAMLDALLVHHADPQVPLLERLIGYGPGEVVLSKVMENHCIRSSDQLREKLGLDELVPRDWREAFPALDLELALKNSAKFIVDDCVGNQKPDGVRAFNKLKHGLLVVPQGVRYLRESIDAPAALFKSDKSSPEARSNPLSLFAVPMSDEHLEERLRSIHFIQVDLRLFAALHVLRDHPEVLIRRGISAPLDLFRLPYMRDVLEFIAQLTARDKPHQSPDS
jgi:hypothetical protein